MELMAGVRVKPGSTSGKSHIIKGQDLSEIFGIDLAEGHPDETPSRASKAGGNKRGAKDGAKGAAQKILLKKIKF